MELWLQEKLKKYIVISGISQIVQMKTLIVSMDESQGYLGFTRVMPLPPQIFYFIHDYLKIF